LAGEKADASSEESSTRTEPFGAEVDELEVEEIDRLYSSRSQTVHEAAEDEAVAQA
jgi:hypothetical protein